jgi:hypothetical protein
MKKMTEERFVFKDKRPLKEKVVDFLESLPFWRGRKRGMIYTRNIEWDDIREIFFPQSFEEKYGYLGSVPYNENSDLFKAMYPLILAMDYEARPKGCPRWFLRFLHTFGSDKSVVRVRNFRLHNLEKKLTKGIFIWDYKTKWSHYDLRITLSAPKHLQELADDIERGFHKRGRIEEVIGEIKRLDPTAKITNTNLESLEKLYSELRIKEIVETSNTWYPDEPI